jgi:hypothetical protein
MSLQLYAVYARCTHCGIYDRDPEWCVMCGKPKNGARTRGAEDSGTQDNGSATLPCPARTPVTRQKNARR